MKWHIGSTVRTALIASGVAAITAVAVAAGPALAQRSAPAATPAPPVIVSGVGHNTVFLGGFTTYRTLGTLHLSKGSWTIFGKANVSGQTVELHCRITAGSDSDTVDPQIDQATVFSQQFVVNVTHKFTSAGNVV